MNRIVFLFALLVGLSATVNAADDIPDERFLKTDVGKVALQKGDCPIKNKHGFEYAAYATDETVVKTGKPEVHLGCWYKVPGMVYIWFYNEPDAPVASYRDILFVVE